MDLTIVVPTFNEGGNVGELVARIESALPADDVEVLFVDDSTDDTPEVVRQVAQSSRLPVRLLHRPVPVGGLSGAVTEGIDLAKGEFIVVMDGDLQHPPAMIPMMREQLDRYDLVVASRYCEAGDAVGLADNYRRMVSSSSTMLARALLGRRVGDVCTDPMTGFFGFRRDAIVPSRLRPRGFKILLEILARHDLTVAEVPFVFGERYAGQSKASWRQGAQFLFQVFLLRLSANSSPVRQESRA
jgi:dolichol-phosphate mannosyltransferase